MNRRTQQAMFELVYKKIKEHAEYEWFNSNNSFLV